MGQAQQGDFEQRLAEASQAAPVLSRGSAPLYPYLSIEDRNLIDRVIAQYAAQKKPKPETVRDHTRALRRLANDIRARGQTTDLADHKSLLHYANTYFPKDARIRSGVSVLRAYHGFDPHHPYLSTDDRNLIDSMIAEYAAQKSLKPSSIKYYTTAVRRLANDLRAHGQMADLADNSVLDYVNTCSQDALMKAGVTVLRAYHDFSQSTAAKRRRLNDLEDVVVHRQPGADASSGGNSPAPVASTGVIIRGSSDDTRPLYPEDAADILRLKEALIKGRSMTASSAKKHANSLISFSRWLFEKNKPSIIARLDGKSLTDGCDVHEFSAGSDANRLVRALEHLRTFRSPGGVAPIVRPGRDDAAAQHSTSHGASTRLEEPRDWRNDQPAPSAFIEERAASGSDQLRYGELRRMVDSLDDPAAQSPVSLVSEGLRRLEKQVRDELHGLGDDHAAFSFSIDPEEHTFEPEQFSPGELRRLLDSEPAEERQEWRDDQPAPATIIEERSASDSDQLRHGKLRRVLDHLDGSAAQSPGSVASDEFQRLEKQLHDELHG
ncbi:hypothetical protein [Bradyrhizobium sp. USDA 4461]